MCVCDVVALFRYIARSKQLSSLRTTLLTSHTPIDIDTTLTHMEQIKHITLTRIERANVTVCLQSISNIHSIIQLVETTKTQSFDWNKTSHFALIDHFWLSMYPNVTRKNRMVSSEWGELGFQGKDPSSDFRGMGMLGLVQLDYFASVRSSEARRVLGDSMHVRRYYPFSATGINITAFVLELLRENRLHAVLMKNLEKYCLDSRSSQMTLSSFTVDVMGSGGDDDGASDVIVKGCCTLHDIYCDVFIYFNDLWVERDPPNIMSFAAIFEEVKSNFRSQFPAVAVA